MEITDVYYEDGFVHIVAAGREYTREFTPSIILPAFSPDLVEIPAEAKVVFHPHSVEVFADLDTLVDLQRDVSRVTRAYTFLPPERQFLLRAGVSYHSPLVDGMVTLRSPVLSSRQEAFEYLLRSKHGVPARVFLENVAYIHKIPADLSTVGGNTLDDALHIVLQANLSPVTIFRGDALLPISRVRIHPEMPVSYLSSDPFFSSSYRAYAEGDVVPLSDAMLLDADYEMVLPVHVDVSRPSPFATEMEKLLATAERALRTIRIRDGDIRRYAVRSNSSSVLSAYYILDVVRSIISGLPALLSRTNYLTPIGREALFTLAELRRRDKKVYSYFCPTCPICSRVLRRLEYLLPVLSNLPLERPRSWRYRRARGSPTNWPG